MGLEQCNNCPRRKEQMLLNSFAGGLRGSSGFPLLTEYPYEVVIGIDPGCGFTGGVMGGGSSEEEAFRTARAQVDEYISQNCPRRIGISLSGNVL